MVELNLYNDNRCHCVLRIVTETEAKRIGLDLIKSSADVTAATITKDCGYCADGKVNCGNCGGQGCDRCNGTGQVDCLECDGLGEKTIDVN